MKNQSLLFNPILWLIASLTLGLAPFTPEPHVWEKIQWVISGAQGMKLIDWFDFLMHGTPWVMLLISLVCKFKK